MLQGLLSANLVSPSTLLITDTTNCDKLQRFHCYSKVCPGDKQKVLHGQSENFTRVAHAGSQCHTEHVNEIVQTRQWLEENSN
jgi:hypothetical protein